MYSDNDKEDSHVPGKEQVLLLVTGRNPLFANSIRRYHAVYGLNHLFLKFVIILYVVDLNKIFILSRNNFCS
jgi:hypothetical protein